MRRNFGFGLRQPMASHASRFYFKSQTVVDWHLFLAFTNFTNRIQYSGVQFATESATTFSIVRCMHTRVQWTLFYRWSS